MIRGIIYKIYQHDRCYIGSTTRSVRQRFLEHKRWSKYNLYNSSSCKILFNDYEQDPEYMELDIIELIDLSYAERRRLRDLEIEWISKTDDTVNKITSKSTNETYMKYREQINKNKKQQRMVCECGTEICSYQKKKHMLSKKHIRLLQELQK